MKQKTTTIIFAALIIFLGMKVSLAHAQDYFVDAANGNDSWDGKAQSYEGGTRGPWRTSDAPNWNGNFVGDDRILFKRDGEYSRLLVTSRHQSTDGHPIIFGAYGIGEKPIITIANNIVANWVAVGGGRYSSQINTTSVDVVMEEDWHDLDRADNADLLDGEWYFDKVTQTLYYRPTNGVPSDHEVRYGNAAGFAFWQRADNFVIQDLHFIGAGINHGLDGPEPFKNIIVERCDFSSNTGNWLEATGSDSPYNGAPARDIIIQDCTFRNARSNIYTVGQNYHGSFERLIIRRNSFINTDIRWDGKRYSLLTLDNDYPYLDIDAISIQNMKDSIIEHNEVVGGCYSGGILVWLSSDFAGTGNIIRYNYIHDIDPSAIHYGGEDSGISNAEIYGNVIENVGSSVYPYNQQPWGGICVSRAQTAATPTKIYNNVIHNADTSFKFEFGDHCIVKNNISSAPRKGQHIYEMAGHQHNIFDYNIYYGSVNNFSVSYQDKTFEEWRYLSGQDFHSRIVDPLFSNDSGLFSKISDFHLESSSPAIDAGAAVGLTSDFEGTPVPQGTAPDIGAFEYSSGTPQYRLADINQDNSVNVIDLGILMSDFGLPAEEAGNPRSDINSDGLVNVQDLGMMMSEWGG